VPPLVRHGRPAPFRAHYGRGRPGAREAVQQAYSFGHRGRRGDLSASVVPRQAARPLRDRCGLRGDLSAVGRLEYRYLLQCASKAYSAASRYTQQLFYSFSDRNGCAACKTRG